MVLRIRGAMAYMYAHPSLVSAQPFSTTDRSDDSIEWGACVAVWVCAYNEHTKHAAYAWHSHKPFLGECVGQSVGGLRPTGAMHTRNVLMYMFVCFLLLDFLILQGESARKAHSRQGNDLQGTTR